MILKYRSDFGDYLNSLHLVGQGAEVGVKRGVFSELILSKWKGQKLFCIDCWEEQEKEVYNDASNVPQNKQEEHLKETKKRLKKFGDRFFIIREMSTIAASAFDDESLDFVYIDANHKYEYVKQDIEAWYTKVRYGGLISGHDYLNGEIPVHGNFGVKQAVDEFAKRVDTKIQTTKEPWPSWFFVKNRSLL